MLHIAVYLDYCAWQLEAQWLIYHWAVSGGVLIFLLNVSQWMCFYSPYWKKLLEWCPWDCKYVSHQTNQLFIAHQNSFGVSENTIFWTVSYRPSLCEDYYYNAPKVKLHRFEKLGGQGQLLVILFAKALCKQYIELFTVWALPKKDIGSHNQTYTRMLLDNLSFSHSNELLFIMSSPLLSYSKSRYSFSKSFTL